MKKLLLFDGLEVHLLKVNSADIMLDLLTARKTFEIRKNDRDYKKGDVLVLCLYLEDFFDPDCYCVRRVTYVFPGGRYGIEPGYCVLCMEEMPLYGLNMNRREFIRTVVEKHHGQNSQSEREIS